MLGAVQELEKEALSPLSDPTPVMLPPPIIRLPDLKIRLPSISKSPLILQIAELDIPALDILAIDNIEGGGAIDKEAQVRGPGCTIPEKVDLGQS